MVVQGNPTIRTYAKEVEMKVIDSWFLYPVTVPLYLVSLVLVYILVILYIACRKLPRALKLAVICKGGIEL